ncbi:hypothetical protein MBT42_39145 [Streptomyces sp. MBT42]|uniref:hypothetical protein n=1 Tax=Streptomyces sp. MBT42 TaxID=1488373 RepID=UPI001E6336F3|nr:hypothetical protein [Streptomyces sp. MBT42]MCD2469534.1 hypothetical protein [Streptomyces sp. MBT42]
MGIADTSIAAAAAAFSGIAAFASWKASQRAHGTAESVAQIERDRWHKELTPQVAVVLGGAHSARLLIVRFNGPVGLGRLDAVQLTIRDDRDRSKDPVLGTGPTAEERAQFIFGPFRFRRGADGADSLGRTVDPFALDVHDEWRLALDLSTVPYWCEGVEGDRSWRGRFPADRDKLRLWIECEAQGHRPWKLSAEVAWNEDWVQAG